MSDEAALLAAIITHSGEDTPRLAYADWLDEHRGPAAATRAAFIRTQCAYSVASPTQREYPDLQEGLWYTQARCEWQLKAERPVLPAGFTFSPQLNDENYRRGFVHSVRPEWYASYQEPTDDQITQLIQGLEPLTTNTTARKLTIPHVTPPQLARILAAPGINRLESLVIEPLSHVNGDEIAETLLAADTIRGLQQLHLRFTVHDTGARALARCEFNRLELFDLPSLDCEPDALAELVGARWFRSLMQVRYQSAVSRVLGPVLAALAQLPRLEFLVLHMDHPPAAGTFPAPDGFRELAQLFLTGQYASRCVSWLARSRMPKLIELRVQGLTNNGLRALRSAPWFNQLWILLLNESALNDRSVTALTRSPLPDLRILQLGDNPFGRDGLLALADGARLPSLTTLNLNSTRLPAAPAPDVVAFPAALNRPQLRNLWLAHWPLGTDGVKALAANPSLSNLTSLVVRFCGVNDAGLNALVRAPHLQKLVELDASGNELRKPAALLDPRWLPRLSQCWLRDHRFSAATTTKLTESRDWYVEFAYE